VGGRESTIAMLKQLNARVYYGAVMMSQVIIFPTAGLWLQDWSYTENDDIW